MFNANMKHPLNPLCGERASPGLRAEVGRELSLFETVEQVRQVAQTVLLPCDQYGHDTCGSAALVRWLRGTWTCCARPRADERQAVVRADEEHADIATVEEVAIFQQAFRCRRRCDPANHRISPCPTTYPFVSVPTIDRDRARPDTGRCNSHGMF